MFGIIVGILVLLFVVLQVVGGGEHGPDRHASARDGDVVPIAIAPVDAPSRTDLAPFQARHLMTVAPGLRRLALMAHVTFSVGWIGAVASFLALATTGVVTSDERLMHAAYLAMEPITRLVIVPFAGASLLTGLVSSLISPWACSGTTGWSSSSS